MLKNRIIDGTAFRFATAVLLFLLLYCQVLPAQEKETKWHRTTTTEQYLQLFHSTTAFNLPTAETLQKGDMQFELAHRFTMPVSSGWSGAYGLDGTVIMCIGLDYALSDRLLLALTRSNLEGNVELRSKYKILEINNTLLPTVIAVQAGLAYNGKAVGIVENTADKFQYFASAILNTMYHKKLAIGLVPSYLHNSYIYCKDIQHSFTMGEYAQYYVSPFWSLLVEVNSTVTGWRDRYNSFACGIEVETGGHFFKILVGTNTRLNNSQYLAGAPDSFQSKYWHIGFNLTRLFSIKSE
jgi:hypothetical protein